MKNLVLNTLITLSSSNSLTIPSHLPSRQKPSLKLPSSRSRLTKPSGLEIDENKIMFCNQMILESRPVVVITGSQHADPILQTCHLAQPLPPPGLHVASSKMEI